MARTKSKGSSASGRNSPSARPEELESLEVAETEPDQAPANALMGTGKKKKSKKAAAADEVDVDPAQEAAVPKKKKQKKAAAAALADDQDEEGGAEAEDGIEAMDFDLEQIQEAVKMFRGQYKRKPSATELAEALDLDEATAKKALKAETQAADRLANAKAAARVRGYRKLSKLAGFAYTKDSVAVIDRGVDSLNSLLSMSDGLRLGTFMPSTPGAVTYDQEEFQSRAELMDTTLPEGAAREVVANADAVFKWAINEATKATMLQRGTQGIYPSTMIGVLKPFAPHMQFSSIEAPAGLVKYAKDEPPPERGDYADAEKKGADGKKVNKAWEKAMTEYKSRVAYADRGMGLVDMGEDVDAGEKKLAADNKKTAAGNLKFHTKAVAALEAVRSEKRKRRDAATQKREAVATQGS